MRLLTPLKATAKFLLLGLVVVALIGCGSGKESAPSTIISRIINGTPVGIEETPQIVRITIARSDGETFLCTGVVIGPQHVLTAGHCLAEIPAGYVVSTIFGDLPAIQIIRHPGYLPHEELGAVFNDVAVLITEPHGLPGLPILTSLPIPVEQDVVTFGYGLDENGLAGALKGGATRMITVTPNHLYSLPFSGSGTNACFGDSGAPAVATVTTAEGFAVTGIIGLVSSGTSTNCVDNDTTLYTNLQNPGLLEFLTAVVGEIPLS